MLRWLAAAALLASTPALAQQEEWLAGENPTEDTSPVNADPEELDSNAIDLLMFVDAYGLVDWGFPKPQDNTGPARAFDFANGFALQWLGVDLSLRRGPIGGTVAVRYGPSTPRLMGRGELDIKQAYATYEPTDGVTVDFGVFDTLYGAEGGNSFDNLNYSVGSLFFVAQPFYHTGLRVAWQVRPKLKLGGLLVNGWNNFVDNNRGKTAGVQVTWEPSAQVTTALGFITGPEQDDAMDSNANRRFRDFIDAIAIIRSGPLEIWLNADLGLEDVVDENGAGDSVVWWGAMAAARYRFDPKWAIAGRLEVLGDPDAHLLGVDDLTIITATTTFDYRPHPLLIVRLDNRVDRADSPIYPAGADGAAEITATTVLGVVVRTP